jgi:predicted acyl esterase
MGGCLLVEKFYWASTMLSINAAPPDPAVVGEKWRALWLERLDQNGLWLIEWLRHQRRDEFYEHGSVCVDWSAIQCPVYAVGGWADGYANAVFRLLANLTVPRKGLVGPWAHKYPHFAKPGPQIGFLHECLRWWDHWLKGHDTGIMKEPMLRAWLEDPSPPRSHHDEKPGRWVAEPVWPSREIIEKSWSLERGRLARDQASKHEEVLPIRSPQTVGLASATWYTLGLGHDQPTDQRIEAGGSLCFDTDVLDQDVELLGAPIAELELSADRPNAFVACTLSEIMPDQSVARISYGLLNLTHRDSHEHPTPLAPGESYRVQVRMNEVGHRFAAGNRLRLAISTAFWPIAWPSPEPVTLSVHLKGSALRLPVRPKRSQDASLAPFPAAAGAPALRKTYLDAPREKRTITTDVVTGEVEWLFSESEGTYRIEDIDLTRSIQMQRRLLIHPANPTSARAEARASRAYSRGDWRTSAEVSLILTCDRDRFRVIARMDAYEGESRIFSRSWDESIPRDLV